MICIVCNKEVKKRNHKQKYCGYYYKKGDCAWIVSKLQTRISSIKERCTNPKHKNYKAYKNVAICKEWIKNTKSFVDWAIKNGYKPGLEIDRIDNTKGYNPDNCRFVTRIENCRNKRNNVTDWKKRTRRCRICKVQKKFKDMMTSRKEVGGIAYECRDCRKNIDKIRWKKYYK